MRYLSEVLHLTRLVAVPRHRQRVPSGKRFGEWRSVSGWPVIQEQRAKSHWPAELRLFKWLERLQCLRTLVHAHSEHQRPAPVPAAGRSAIAAQLLAAAEMN